MSEINSGDKVVCKGKNCTAVDGVGHSDECERDHDAEYATTGNKHPVARYRGYKGEPLSPNATKDELEAWKEGDLAKL